MGPRKSCGNATSTFFYLPIPLLTQTETGDGSRETGEVRRFSPVSNLPSPDSETPEGGGSLFYGSSMLCPT